MKDSSTPTTAALERLTERLNSLPGIGPKSAQRLAFHILRADDEYVEAPGDPMAWKNAWTSAEPTFSFQTSSGGKVTTRQTVPHAGGSMVCGK